MKAPIHTDKKKKVIRTAALSGSLYVLLEDQLRFLNQYYDILAIGSDPGHEYMEKLKRREGIRGKEINIERKISIFNDFISLYKLYVLFRKEKPFMVHSITPKAGLLTMIAGYFARVPARVHTFTGLIFPTQTGMMKKVLLFFDKLICKFATHVYPEGNGVKNDLMNYKVTSKPLKVIANGNVNGINLDKYTAALFSKEENNKLRSTIGISENDLVFLFIGRLVNDKGVNELVNAFSKLSSTHEHVKLVMVGAHIGETDLLPDETWAKIKTNTAILYVGHQNDVRPYFAMSDIFVFPSYREGFPNVVLEAGAMGLPAIVTDINGSNEIIEHNINGIIVPSKDTEALLNAMETCIENSDLMRKLANCSRDRIATHYERNFVWNEILAEYRLIEQDLRKNNA